MNKRERYKIAFEELGKHSLNIGVAVIVFAIIQPIVGGSLNFKIAIFASIFYVILLTIGVFFLYIGGDCNE